MWILPVLVSLLMGLDLDILALHCSLTNQSLVFRATLCSSSPVEAGLPVGDTFSNSNSLLFWASARCRLLKTNESYLVTEAVFKITLGSSHSNPPPSSPAPTQPSFPATRFYIAGAEQKRGDLFQAELGLADARELLYLELVTYLPGWRGLALLSAVTTNNWLIQGPSCWDS